MNEIAATDLKDVALLVSTYTGILAVFTCTLQVHIHWI